MEQAEQPAMKQGTKADDIVEQYLYSKSPSDDIEISPSLKEINRTRGSKISHCTGINDLWLMVSVVTFAAEIASAVAVAVKYYESGSVWWFGLTSGFLLLASFTMQIFSLRWFFEDGKATHPIIYIVHVLQLGPMLRYCNTMKSSWRCRNERRSANEYHTFLVEWRDVTMLRLFQAFLLSAPQMVLQLYVMAMHRSVNSKVVLFAATAASCSTLSLIWTLVTHSKVLREFRKTRSSLLFTGFLLQVLWRASMVSSRVVALVLFASHFAKWLLLAVAIHWALMTLWLICQRNKLCTDEQGRDHPLREKLFSAVIGFIYIFCFFNIKEGITRKRLVFFYSLMLVENSLLVAMWYPNRTFQGMAVFAALVSVWGGFAFGIVCMILYYYFYHPSLPVQGIFLRKRTFDVEGRRGYNLVFCCCCQFKTRETTYGDCVQSEGHEVVVKGAHQLRASPPFEMEILPRTASRDLYREAGSSAGSRAEILVHSTSRKPDNPWLPLAVNDSPDVALMKANSRACNPRDSVSNSSLVTRSDLELEFDNAGHIIQPLFCTLVRSENEVLPEQFTILDTSRDTPTERLEGSLCAAPLNMDEKVEKLLTEDKSAEVEVEVPRINYGTLSFGNRYSLVSSDCISLSSESSRSSIDSIIFEDEGRPTVRINDGNAPEVALTPRTADEGIYSDERFSTGVHRTSNVKTASLTQDRSLNSVLSSPDDENLGYLEYLMDAASPLPLRAQQRTAESASEKEDDAESESDWHTDASSDAGPSVHCSLQEIKRRETGSSPGSHLSRSDAVAQKRHTFDFSDLSGSKSGKRRRPARSQRRRSRRKEFDNFVATYLKPGKFGSLRRSCERLAKIQEDSEDLSVFQDIDVIPEAPCSLLATPELKTPSGELNGIERFHEMGGTPMKPEDSSRDIINGVTRNNCVEEERGMVMDEESDSDKESATLDQHGIPDDESSSSQSSPINKVNVERVKAEFVKRRRLKRFMSKGFAPGKYSSVRLSYERIPIDEVGRESYNGDEQQNHNEEGTAVDFERASCRVNEHCKSKRLENGFSENREVSNNSCLADNLLAHDEGVNCSRPSSGSYSSLTASPDKRHTYDFSLLSTEHSKRPAVNGSAANDSLKPLMVPLSPVWVPQPLASNQRMRRPRSAVLFIK